MSKAEAKAWDTALSISPQELMAFYQAAGELSDLHRELYAGFQDRGHFVCVHQTYFFYSAAADLHASAFLAQELNDRAEAVVRAI
ncbi:MAG: hypothetical protein ACR2O2_03715 [Ruegeria sp.]